MPKQLKAKVPNNNKIAESNTDRTNERLPEEVIPNLRIVGDVISKLMPIQNQIEIILEIALKYRLALGSPKLLFKLHKNWIAFSMALELHESYLNSRGQFPEETTKTRIEDIAKYDPELAERISKIIPISQGKRVFIDLIGEY